MITKIDAELLIYIIMCLSVRTYALRHIMSRYASQLIIEKEKEKNLIDLGLEPESSDLAGQPTRVGVGIMSQSLLWVHYLIIIYKS